MSRSGTGRPDAGRPGVPRAALAFGGLLDVYGWAHAGLLAGARHYGDAALWAVGAAALGHAVIRDWRRAPTR